MFEGNLNINRAVHCATGALSLVSLTFEYVSLARHMRSGSSVFSQYEGVADKVVTACRSTISKSLKMLENQGFFDIHSELSQRPGKIFQKFQKILRDHGLKRSFLALLLSKKYKRKFVHTFLTTTQCLSAEFHRNQEFFGSHTSNFHIFIFYK